MHDACLGIVQVNREGDGSVGAEQCAARRGAALLQLAAAALPGPPLLHRYGLPPHLRPCRAGNIIAAEFGTVLWLLLATGAMERLQGFADVI
jgi:hypothetical protein